MAESEVTDQLIRSVLRLVRTHLGLDVAFVSQLLGDRRVFRYVDAEGTDAPVGMGDWDPAEDSYCQRVLDGRLPEFIREAAAHPAAAEPAVTHDLPVGTHLSVPIVLSDGSVYGMFCAAGTQVCDSLDEGELDTVRMLAELVAPYVEEAEGRRRQVRQRRRRLQTIVPGEDLRLVFQPIVDLATGAVAGVEALARFPRLDEGPAPLFAEAWRLGLGLELELTAVGAVLDQLPLLPRGVYLSVNVSPATVVSERFRELVRAAAGPDRVVVEVTEHAPTDDYRRLVAALGKLRELGIRLAIDDVGTGFSGLDQILRLAPHILKIDRALMADLDRCPARQAMIAALVTFGERTDSEIVAEGIESEAQVRVLRELEVAYGQGHHLGRPTADLAGLVGSPLPLHHSA